MPTVNGSSVLYTAYSENFSKEITMNSRPQALTNLLKSFTQTKLYLLFVASSLVAFALNRHFNINLEMALLGVSVVQLGLIIALERWLPFQTTWQAPQGDVLTDSSSAIVLVGLVDPVLKAALPLLAIFLLSTLPASNSFHPASTSLINWGAFSFWSAALIALGWTEFAKYWAHRLHHRVKALWWLHALHHSSGRLYWLNGFRFHPLNYAINTGLSVLPLWLIGTPVEVMLGVQAIAQPVILLQHSNISLRSGWLKRILSTNETHRAHHSKHADTANSNYGSAFLVWDHVFGTYRAAQTSLTLAEVGLFEGSQAYPATHSYWQQLRSMFSPNCCQRAS